MITELPAVKLAYREGASDKVYVATIERAGELFVVNCAWGRRGATLTAGTKTVAPVELAEARRVYEKVVAEKVGKGYQVVESAAAIPADARTMKPVAPRPVKVEGDYLPQLLNPMTPAEANQFIKQVNGTWCCQEKFDGKRLLVHKRAGEVIATQRQGKPCALPEPVHQSVAELPGDLILDGELIGDVYHVFDLLMVEGQDNRPTLYGKRLNQLRALLSGRTGAVELAETIQGETNIRGFVQSLKSRNAEGVVFKDLCAPYVAGRPNSGGTQRKVKFWASCSCVVVRHNAQRSVTVGLSGVELGNVTIPPNHVVPAVGTVVEVRYLYYYANGSLYQPVYLGERNDVPAADLTVEKQNLKLKPQGE